MFIVPSEFGSFFVIKNRFADFSTSLLMMYLDPIRTSSPFAINAPSSGAETVNEFLVHAVTVSHPSLSAAPDELLQIAFSTPNMFAPDEDYHYSNTNTVLLGMVIEKITGKRLADYLKENIFIPLKLTHTIYPADEKLPTPYAHGYTLQTPNHEEVDASLWDPNWTDAAGLLVSRFDDLAIWAKVLGTGKLLSKESFKEMTNWRTVPKTKNKLKYGITLGNFEGMIFHTGELPGYNTFVAYSPSEHFAIVISTNTDTPVKLNDTEVPPVTKIFAEIEKVLAPKYIKGRWN